YVGSQEVYDKYWHWSDYRHEPAKNWPEVTWNAIRHKMSRDDLLENFGEYLGDADVNKIPLNFSPKTEGKYRKEVESAYKKAEVWEIWDKTMRQRVWIVPGYDKVCKKEK